MFKESVIAQKKKLDFEKKQRLKAISLGNKFLGEWASNVLGYNQLQKRKYVSRINKVGLKYDNSRKIIRKIEKDFIKNNIKISFKEIENKIKDFQMKANVIIENNLKFKN